jgi:hypothetical protein
MAKGGVMAKGKVMAGDEEDEIINLEKHLDLKGEEGEDPGPLR